MAYGYGLSDSQFTDDFSGNSQFTDGTSATRKSKKSKIVSEITYVIMNAKDIGPEKKLELISGLLKITNIR